MIYTNRALGILLKIQTNYGLLLVYQYFIWFGTANIDEKWEKLFFQCTWCVSNMVQGKFFTYTRTYIRESVEKKGRHLGFYHLFVKLG